MSLRLRLRSNSTIPISVRGVTPHSTKDLSAKNVASLPIWYGNRQLPLGEFFDVAIMQSEGHVWEGELSNVHWLGGAMCSGKIVVEGNIGRHLGSRMIGGEIEVKGNASDFVACENRGGVVRIDGNAGDWVGAAYPGTKSGSDGGNIFVHGNAGGAVGSAMRRGCICVMGNAGDLVGWNMLAGTIVVGKKIGNMSGRGMVRGTILLPEESHSQFNANQLPISFTEGSTSRPSFLKLFQSWLNENAVRIPVDRKMEFFHGDQLKGGRGEVLLAAS